MGQIHQFECPSCQYEANCSTEIDRGFYVEVKPMICLDCKEIHNIAIGEFDQDNNHKKFKKIECPECNNSNLKDWINRVCPKCETKMNKGNKKTILWD